MKEITEKLLSLKEVTDYTENLKNKVSPITILGLSDVSKACITAFTGESTKRMVLLVTYNELQAQKLHRDLKNMDTKVTYIPKKDIITYDYDAQSRDILYQRIDGIVKLFNNEAEITVLSIETLMQPILTKKQMKNSILKVLVAKEYNLEEIKEKLVYLGYERCDMVEGKGTFSVRGDILDIAISNKNGIRIEFFGDEVDQIRYFDISSQRSTENVNQVQIFPITEDIEKEPNGSIIEYLSESAIIVFDELNKISLRSENILNDNVFLIKDLIEKEKNVPYILENMYNIEQLLGQTANFQIVELDFQDIVQGKENTITFKYEDIKQIDDKFLEITKQEKEKKTYKPRTRVSNEFREAEKITFSDLKVRRLCST